MAPTRKGCVNAIQVQHFTDGAQHKRRVTVISLQSGKELVTVAAINTVRWIEDSVGSGLGRVLASGMEGCAAQTFELYAGRFPTEAKAPLSAATAEQALRGFFKVAVGRGQRLAGA